MELNDNVVVTLTEVGAKILNEHYESMNLVYKSVTCSNDNIFSTDFKEGDYFSAELWEMFYIFGNHCMMGADIAFTNLEKIEKI